MLETTNLLRAKVKRFTAPLLALTLLLFTAAFVVVHQQVNAAMAPSTAPLSDDSISPLLSLDQAVEAVASKVTPSVVHIAVTSHAHQQDAEAQGEGEDQGDNPFSQFFGPGSGHGFGQQGPEQGQGP